MVTLSDPGLPRTDLPRGQTTRRRSITRVEWFSDILVIQSTGLEIGIIVLVENKDLRKSKIFQSISGRNGQRSAPMPAYLDEVTVLQQPRGSYTLEVFRGFLAVGDEFWFTSRRVEGSSFSLTIFVNKQCHVRLSACCESKRKIGTRLGQGVFQLVRVEQAEPCVR